jgi:hypothetical protein
MDLQGIPTAVWIGVAAVAVMILNSKGIIKLPNFDLSSGLLKPLEGYKTKIAALMIAILAANEYAHFLPDNYVTIILYAAGALGLYGVRDAIERLRPTQPQQPTQQPQQSQQPQPQQPTQQPTQQP